jgi:hypothetical protein
MPTAFDGVFALLDDPLDDARMVALRPSFAPSELEPA